MNEYHGLAWRKSSYSACNGACVEIAASGDHVAVRHSKAPVGPVIAYTQDEFRAFVEGAKAGEFDDLL